MSILNILKPPQALKAITCARESFWCIQDMNCLKP